MSDLAGFLAARLDAAEATARKVQAVLDGGWNYFDEVPTELIDPARVLREVDARRKILAMYLDAVAEASSEVVEWMLAVIETEASIYSDHPDYDPAWAG